MFKKNIKSSTVETQCNTLKNLNSPNSSNKTTPNTKAFQEIKKKQLLPKPKENNYHAPNIQNIQIVQNVQIVQNLNLTPSKNSKQFMQTPLSASSNLQKGRKDISTIIQETLLESSQTPKKESQEIQQKIDIYLKKNKKKRTRKNKKNYEKQKAKHLKNNKNSKEISTGKNSKIKESIVLEVEPQVNGRIESKKRGRKRKIDENPDLKREILIEKLIETKENAIPENNGFKSKLRKKQIKKD